MIDPRWLFRRVDGESGMDVLRDVAKIAFSWRAAAFFVCYPLCGLCMMIIGMAVVMAVGMLLGVK